MGKNVHVLVTGAGGFIGRSVVYGLLNNGYNVCAMVRPSKIAPFKPDPRLRVLWADIRNYSDYADKVMDIDTIIHLAADKYHPKLSYEVNLQGARNLVRLLDEKKIRGNRFINISSQSTKIKIKGVYGNSKLLSDKIITSSNYQWTTLKPSLVYGKEEGTLFQTIAHYAQTLPFIPVIGNGKWELYPITVEDLAMVICKTINSPVTVKKTYDIGSKEKIIFDDLILNIQKTLKINKPLLHIPFIPGLIMVYLMKKIFPMIPISIDNVLGSNQSTNCRPSVAIKDLKLELTPLEEGINRIFNPGKQKKIKVAVVGLGKMGILHSSVLNTIPDCQIVALIDKDKQLTKTAQSMGIKAKFYPDLSFAINDQKIDAVYICTPTFAHKEIIDICLRNDLPYFVEKPVFNRFDSFKDLLKLENRPINDQSATGYFWIYRREAELTKKLLLNNEIGKIKSYKIILKHGEVFGQKKGWLFRKNLSGGGVLINPGPHAFSLICYLFGHGIVEKSRLKYLYKNDVEDEAFINLNHPNGVKGILDASWSVPNQPVLSIEYEIIGEKGSIAFYNKELIIKRLNRANQKIKLEHLRANYSVFDINPGVGGDAYYVEDKLFIRNLIEKKQLVNNIKFAYMIESLINECYEKAN